MVSTEKPKRVTKKRAPRKRVTSASSKPGAARVAANISFQRNPENLNIKEANEKKREFLKHIRITGNITVSAEHCGIAAKSHYKWLVNDHDGSYRAAFEMAQAEYKDRVEHVAHTWGVHGLPEVQMYKGSIARDEEGNPITVNKRSERLLIETLRAIKPNEYRDRTVVHTGTVGLTGEVTHSHRAISAASRLLDEVLPGKSRGSITRETDFSSSGPVLPVALYPSSD